MGRQQPRGRRTCEAEAETMMIWIMKQRIAEETYHGNGSVFFDEHGNGSVTSYYSRRSRRQQLCLLLSMLYTH